MPNNCANCGGKGGWTRTLSRGRSKWVDCSACGGSGRKTRTDRIPDPPADDTQADATPDDAS